MASLTLTIKWLYLWAKSRLDVREVSAGAAPRVERLSEPVKALCDLYDNKLLNKKREKKKTFYSFLLLYSSHFLDIIGTQTSSSSPSFNGIEWPKSCSPPPFTFYTIPGWCNGALSFSHHKKVLVTPAFKKIKIKKKQKNIGMYI